MSSGGKKPGVPLTRTLSMAPEGAAPSPRTGPKNAWAAGAAPSLKIADSNFEGAGTAGAPLNTNRATGGPATVTTTSLSRIPSMTKMSAAAGGETGSARNKAGPDAKTGPAAGTAAAPGPEAAAGSATGSAAPAPVAETPVSYGAKVMVHSHDDIPAVCISVGEGQQTIRWLSIAAANRMWEASQANGRSRHREIAALAKGRFRPAVVTDMRGRVLAPTARIKDILNLYSAHVYLELTNTPRLNPVTHAFEQTTWASDAFSSSDAGRARAMKLLNRDREAEQKLKAAEEEKQRQEELARYNALVSQMSLTDVDSPDFITKSVDMDWSLIRLDRFSLSSDSELISVKRLIMENFMSITDVFKHFCGSVPSSDVGTMCLTEWQHCVVYCNLISNRDRDSPMIQSVFNSALSRRHLRLAYSEHGLSRFEFIEALIGLASAKLQTDRAALARGWSLVNMLGHMLKEGIQNACNSLVLNTRDAMRAPEVQAVLASHSEFLRRIYDKYRVLDASDKPATDQFALSILEFTRIFQDADMVAATDVDGRLTLAAISQIFSGSQREDDPYSKGAQSAMVWSEFLDALVKVALLKFPGPNMTPKDKVFKLMQALVKVDPSASLSLGIAVKLSRTYSGSLLKIRSRRNVLSP